MATEYRLSENRYSSDPDTLVARTWWGGAERGMVVEVGPGLADPDVVITSKTILYGPGAMATLGQLARLAGSGRHCVIRGCEKPARHKRALCADCFAERNER